MRERVVIDDENEHQLEQDQEDFEGNKPSNRISVRVWSQDNSRIRFTVKKGAKLDKLISAYGVKAGLDIKYCRFLFNGRRIHGNQTAEEAGLTEGAMIDCMLDQTSG